MTLPTLHLCAKTPIPGHVKTRLQTRCNADQAAHISAWCIERTVELALSAWRGPVSLHVWPSQQHRLFRNLRQSLNIDIKRQVRGDLGTKMHSALASAYPGAVMGCDVPHCTPEILTCAAHTLSEGQDVIGSSRDGGYYLIGLTYPHRVLFQDFCWGDGSVYKHTLSKAKALGIRFKELPTLIDLDTWEDIEEVLLTFDPLRQMLSSNGSADDYRC